MISKYHWAGCCDSMGIASDNILVTKTSENRSLKFNENKKGYVMGLRGEKESG